MSLVEHARKELTEAGWFKRDDEDGMYDGMIGEAVMELMETFAKQGHSGTSAQLTIALFERVASYKLLSPMKNPMETGEFMDVAYLSGDGIPMLQSTRKASVFSDDGGLTWYDIDKRVPWWKRMFGVRKHYITFEEEEK